MQNIVGIQYKNTTKTYYFLAPPFYVAVGDMVIVETSNGLAMGKIAFLPREIDETKLDDPLKPVVRIATEKDLARVEMLEQKAKKQNTLSTIKPAKNSTMIQLPRKHSQKAKENSWDLFGALQYVKEQSA